VHDQELELCSTFEVVEVAKETLNETASEE
jgi:hypothetical protein